MLLVEKCCLLSRVKLRKIATYSLKSFIFLVAKLSNSHSILLAVYNFSYPHCYACMTCLYFIEKKYFQ